VNIDLWYAQSHPVEDFAETFAVWLKPRSGWRSKYAGWPALRKLHFVNELMAELREEKPQVRTRKHIEPLRLIRTTLREHYEQRRRHYGVAVWDSYDHELLRLFSRDADNLRNTMPASTFLRRARKRLRRDVSEWTGHYQYMIDQVLEEMIERCEVLNLRLDRDPEEVERDALVVLTMHTMNHIQDESHKVAL
tara:strand:- start:364 stop:942 length:579 start_codon:yes stop_codon:yes gene_type:complete